jgi:hypothetical protein
MGPPYHGTGKEVAPRPARSDDRSVVDRGHAPDDRLDEALTGKWNPPPVMRVREPTLLHAE